MSNYDRVDRQILRKVGVSRRDFIQLSTAAGATFLAGDLLANERLTHVADDPTADRMGGGPTLYVYTITQDGTRESYDEAMTVACLQGIINRDSPTLYVLSKTCTRPQYWLDILSKEGRWLEGRKVRPLANLDAVAKFAGNRLKGAVIWDPAVPASVNVATTVAGVSDGVVFSPEYADRYLKQWNLPIIKDLRGMFTGAETGSKKNDAYRWAIREYLEKGLCSSQLLCLFEDSYFARERGDASYVIPRDWAVKRRAFVFDLSPWGDEKPQDDPEQALGSDLETYRMILTETLRQSAGKHMTEVMGFFVFSKYSAMPDHSSEHNPVRTEWETVWQNSPFNCYQNAVLTPSMAAGASACFNQSLHSQAPWKPLKQRRPGKVPLENKTYVCFLMADYDSATPLYDFLPTHWHNAKRGQVPLAWGINPNLIETYPDIISYFYSTASKIDTFTSDASAAGYMNPNRIAKEHLPLFVEHNRHFFHETDMTIAPMVLDRDQPSAEVKDAFTQFSPDGLATIVMYPVPGGKFPEPHVWKGMPVLDLISIGSATRPDETAKWMENTIVTRGGKTPSFQIFRIIWAHPTYIVDTMTALRRSRPDLNIEVVDPYTFFALFKEHQDK